MNTTNGEQRMTTDTAAPSTAIVTTTTSTRGLLRPIASPKVMLEVMTETRVMLRETLKEGVDYGVIPGTDKGGDKGKPAKKALLKPGAEKICVGFGCRAEFEIVEREVDHDVVKTYRSAWVEAPDPGFDEKARMKEAGLGRNRKVDGEWQFQIPGEGFEEAIGLYRFVIRCRLVLVDGTVVGEGLGSCSSLESKYRSRPHEVENTCLKMACKRAKIDAVLSTFALSEGFTQDLDDDLIAPPPARQAPPVDPKATAKPPATKPPKKDSGATAQQAKDVKTLLAALGVTEDRGAYLDSILPGASTSEQWGQVISALRSRVEAISKPKVDGDILDVDPSQPGVPQVAAQEITDEQRNTILNLTDKAGGDATKPAGRMRLVSSALGREVNALGELTEGEAATVIAALSGANAAKVQAVRDEAMARS